MTVYRMIRYAIAMVWLVNGLFCKMLNLVPRHQEIIARILGEQYAPTFTLLIGMAEIMLAIWVISGKWSRLNAWIQIMVIAIMNVIEYKLVPDLLLWGKINILFATMFILLIYYNEFYLKKPQTQQA